MTYNQPNIQITPVSLPEFEPSPYEIAKMMRINADMIKLEITVHINQEIERMKKECANVAEEIANFVQEK